jgi:hypothetical protein
MPKLDKLTQLKNKLLAELRAQEQNLEAHLARIRADIKQFGKDGPFSVKSGKRRGRPPGKKRRKMSAAGRKAIAAAQKARWAKVKAAKKD